MFVKKETINWSKEWELPEEILKIQPRVDSSIKSREKKHVFLTGATGFLGPLLLFEILIQNMYVFLFAFVSLESIFPLLFFKFVLMFYLIL